MDAFVTHCITFLAGALTVVAASDLGNKLFDRRRDTEAKKRRQQALTPLLSPMRSPSEKQFPAMRSCQLGGDGRLGLRFGFGLGL